MKLRTRVFFDAELTEAMKGRYMDTYMEAKTLMNRINKSRTFELIDTDGNLYIFRSLSVLCILPASPVAGGDEAVRGKTPTPSDPLPPVGSKLPIDKRSGV